MLADLEIPVIYELCQTVMFRNPNFRDVIGQINLSGKL